VAIVFHSMKTGTMKMIAMVRASWETGLMVIVEKVTCQWWWWWW